MVFKLKKEKVGGFASYVGEFKGGFKQGSGSSFDNTDGRIFRGQWTKDRLLVGRTSYLNMDDTRTNYDEMFDDQDKVKAWWDQKPYSKSRV